jgi:hypothetical protein
MLKVITVDAETGKEVEREMTNEEINEIPTDLPVFIE